MHRRALILGLGTTLAGTTMFGTGAFSASQVRDRDANINVVNDADALIGLIPNDRVSGVNLVDGQLAVAMTDGSPVGINANSVYQLGAFVENGSGGLVDEFPNNAFDPIQEENPSDRDEDGEFSSAFLVANQTDEAKDVKFVFVRNGSNGSQSEGTRFAFEAHYDGAVEDTLVFSDKDDDDEIIVVKNLDPGESFGVSFFIDALNGDIGDAFSATFSVTAGEAVSDGS